MAKDRTTAKQFWGKLAATERLATLQGAVFPEDSAEKRATRMAKAILSPASFDVDYLPHYFTQTPAAFHLTLYRIIEQSRLAVVEAPRGHAKTTVITFAYSLRQAAIAGVVRAWNEGRLHKENPLLCAALVRELKAVGRAADESLRWDPFIVIGSCTSDQAVDFTTAIKVELEENPRILGDWGDLVADKGENYADFVLANDVRILAAGMRDSRRGLKHRQWRPTLWIVDDPDDEKTIGSEAVRNKQLRYITRMVRPAVDPTCGRVFLIANETHAECVVAQIYRDQEKPKAEQRFAAWDKFRFTALNDDGEPLWAERFSRELLAELKAEDSDGFETEYMNNPPSGRQRPFKVLGTYNRTELDGVLCPTVQVLDPALGHTRHSDFQAMVVLKLHNQKFYVWRCYLTRLPPPQMRRLFLDVYAGENPDSAGIEAVGFQELLQTLINEMGDDEGLFPLVTGIPQHHAKELRILSLVPLADRGALLFPADGSCSELMKQFSSYPDGKKDGPDVVEMAVRMLRQGIGGPAGPQYHRRRRNSFAGAW